MKKNVIKKLSITLALMKLLNSGSIALADNKSKYSDIFNKENIKSCQFGANQLDFQNNYLSLIKDPLIYEEIQKYFPEKDFDFDEERDYFYKRYLQIIADCGCGYTALTDSIFKYFNGKEELFYQTFGFPMYVIKDDNIDYNYELMTLKMFNYYNFVSSEKRNCLDDVKNLFLKDFYNEKIKILQNSPDYCRKLPDDFNKLSQEELELYKEKIKKSEEAFREIYNKWLNAKNKFKEFGLPVESNMGDYSGFLKTYGIMADTISCPAKHSSIKCDDIVASNGFDLYQESENGERINVIEGMDSHYVYVTDITDDGRILVSSSGSEYYFDDTNAAWTYRVHINYR